MYPLNHTSVWGSWYNKEKKQWGYACCHQCLRNAYCTASQLYVCWDVLNGMVEFIWLNEMIEFIWLNEMIEFMWLNEMIEFMWLNEMVEFIWLNEMIESIC